MTRASEDEDEETRAAMNFGRALLQRAGMLLKDRIDPFALSLHCQRAGAAGVRYTANECLANVLEMNLRGGFSAPGLPP